VKKSWLLTLSLLLAACGGGMQGDPLADLPQAEDDLKAAAFPLADEAEALFTDSNEGIQDRRPVQRHLTQKGVPKAVYFISAKRKTGQD
jgi:hypothetical protein